MLEKVEVSSPPSHRHFFFSLSGKLDPSWSWIRSFCWVNDAVSKDPSSQTTPGWWLNQPLWKIWVNMGIFPKVRGENSKKYLKPPQTTRISRIDTPPEVENSSSQKERIVFQASFFQGRTVKLWGSKSKINQNELNKRRQRQLLKNSYTKHWHPTKMTTTSSSAFWSI